MPIHMEDHPDIRRWRQNDELKEVIRRLRRQGVPIPTDTPRATFYDVLRGILQQMSFHASSRTDSAVDELEQLGAVQFSSSDDEPTAAAKAKTLVDRCEAYRRNQALPRPY